MYRLKLSAPVAQQYCVCFSYSENIYDLLVINFLCPTAWDMYGNIFAFYMYFTGANNLLFQDNYSCNSILLGSVSHSNIQHFKLKLLIHIQIPKSFSYKGLIIHISLHYSDLQGTPTC